MHPSPETSTESLLGFVSPHLLAINSLSFEFYGHKSDMLVKVLHEKKNKVLHKEGETTVVLAVAHNDRAPWGTFS